MANQGWVKLHRKVLENVDLMNDATARLLFFDLLLLSNSKGEVAISGRKLAIEIGMNYSTMYKALARLEEYAIVKQFGKHRKTIIRICNWDKYQSTGKHFGKRSVSTGEALGKQTTGVSRIENKNKERDYKFLEKEAAAKTSLRGDGYAHARAIADELKRRKLV